ncbi:hypothetical protein KSB_14700 [Ktedonobacter robiniae]|uniref:Uncharacterized protein n=1 Tax=Ktedonobacter robiniae TaxID=2778365 RepID=A0ABQ3UJZ7_9CHLR|nr:hypothetical protein KSB_14700 [Ktedonobacter robiniae]
MWLMWYKKEKVLKEILKSLIAIKTFPAKPLMMSREKGAMYVF